MNKSVYDVLAHDVEAWLEPQKNRVLYGGCSDYADYVKSAEWMLTAEKLLEIIQEALQRLEKEQND